MKSPKFADDLDVPERFITGESDYDFLIYIIIVVNIVVIYITS